MKSQKKLDAYQIAIWLIPNQTHEVYLQNLINEIAGATETTSFHPHITLISGFSNDRISGINLKHYHSLLPIRLIVNRINCEADFFKSLFLDFKKSNPLYSLRNELKENLENTYEFIPHLSLAYLDIPVHEKEKIKRKLTIQLEQIEFDRLAIVHTKDAAYGWSNIESWNIYEIS